VFSDATSNFAEKGDIELASMRVGVVDSVTEAEVGANTFRLRALSWAGDAEGGDGAGVPLELMDPEEVSGKS